MWGYITTNQIRGDFIEFGTYEGKTFIESWNQWIYFQKWMEMQMKSTEKWRVENVKDYYEDKPKFIGIDSFKGLPNNDEQDVNLSQDSFAVTKNSVYDKCIDNGMIEDQFELIESFFADIPNGTLTNKAAIIHIDSDIYMSAIEALKICKDIFQQGTVLMFDDYNCFSASNDKGERRALKEFSKETGVVFEPWFAYRNVGQAFLCHLK